MCVWFQSAVHVYQPARSLAENIFSVDRVWRWTHPEAASRFQTSCDDVCLDGYICAATGLFMNVRPLAVEIIGVLLLFIAPILIGLCAMSRRRFALKVFAIWSLMIAYAMYASFVRYREFATADAANQMLLHTPAQVAFNIALLLLLAAPFFLVERLSAALLRWARKARA